MGTAVFGIVVAAALGAVVLSSRGGVAGPVNVAGADADGVLLDDGGVVPWAEIDELAVAVGGRRLSAGRRSWQLRLYRRGGAELVVDGHVAVAEQVLSQCHRLGAVDHALLRDQLVGDRVGRVVCWSRVT